VTSLEIIRGLYDYNAWANTHLLAAAGTLDSDAFAQDLGTSYGSVELNLAHIVAGQVIWLSRWNTGGNPRSVVEQGDMHGYDAVKDAFEASHAELAEFVTGLTEERLAADLHFTNSTGETYDRPLWQLMVHLANHGTHHRAETSMALTGFGHPPRELDYSYFEYERG